MIQPLFLCINKPRNITTYDCVRAVRKLVGRDAKVGHGGTLDPFATGLVIIAIDRQATKHLDKLLGADKRYDVQMLLGTETDSYDTTGTVTQTCSYEHVTRDVFESTLASFKPGYEQTPPIYSALKAGGKPLYELARAGKRSSEALAELAEAKKRYVKLYSVAIDDFKLPYASFSAHVSTGTYIRSLVHDLGVLLGSCATTSELKRTQIGPFTLAQAIDLAAIQSMDDIVAHGVTVEDFLQKLS